MFDFAWSEIALIAAVALIAIGPKDMPVALRAVTDMIKKARRMASEFQTHVDEMMREANLDEVRSQFNEIRNFDVRGALEKTVDPDGSLRSTFDSNPLEPTPIVAASGELAATEPVVAEPLPSVVVEEPPMVAEERRAPAFIPPGMVPPAEAAAKVVEPPPFIPPDAVLQRQPRPSA